MEPWIRKEFGNPSSLHAEGRKARAAIDQAREMISEALGCLFAEVIFTSSGTEAANLAIIGAALANENPKRNRILFSSIEHHCVLHTAPILSRLGYKVELIPVTRWGQIDLEAADKMFADDVLLVSVMRANNEIGTYQPMEFIGERASNVGALVHCDLVQTFPFDSAFADLMTLSAHKINGPKGAGALYVRAGTKVKPLITGGGQERELRAGTEDVAAIVGFDEATKHIRVRRSNKRQSRDVFLSSLNIPNIELSFQSIDDVLPGHAHFRIPGVQAETMLILLDRIGVSASSGAACSSGSIEPSHVLLACGYTPEEAKEGLRFTFGHETTVEEAQEAARRVSEAAARLTSGKFSS